MITSTGHTCIQKQNKGQIEFVSRLLIINIAIYILLSWQHFKGTPRSQGSSGFTSTSTCLTHNSIRVCVCVLQVDFELLQNAQISGKFVNVPEEEDEKAHSGECECEVSMLQWAVTIWH